MSIDYRNHRGPRGACFMFWLLRGSFKYATFFRCSLCHDRILLSSLSEDLAAIFQDELQYWLAGHIPEGLMEMMPHLYFLRRSQLGKSVSTCLHSGLRVRLASLHLNSPQHYEVIWQQVHKKESSVPVWATARRGCPSIFLGCVDLCEVRTVYKIRCDTR